MAGDHVPVARVVAELEVPVPESVAGIMQRRLDSHQRLGCKPCINKTTALMEGNARSAAAKNQEDLISSGRRKLRIQTGQHVPCLPNFPAAAGAGHRTAAAATMTPTTATTSILVASGAPRPPMAPRYG